MVLSRTTAWTALSLTFPLDHFFFLADFPLEVVGFAALLGGYRIEIVRFGRKDTGCHLDWGIVIHHHLLLGIDNRTARCSLPGARVNWGQKHVEHLPYCRGEVVGEDELDDSRCVYIVVPTVLSITQKSCRR